MKKPENGLSFAFGITGTYLMSANLFCFCSILIVDVSLLLHVLFHFDSKRNSYFMKGNTFLQ